MGTDCELYDQGDTWHLSSACMIRNNSIMISECNATAHYKKLCSKSINRDKMKHQLFQNLSVFPLLLTRFLDSFRVNFQVHSSYFWRVDLVESQRKNEIRSTCFLSYRTDDASQMTCHIKHLCFFFKKRNWPVNTNGTDSLSCWTCNRTFLSSKGTSLHEKVTRRNTHCPCQAEEKEIWLKVRYLRAGL